MKLSMRVCYFLQTHCNPAQVHRLVRRIKRASPAARIVIGHDFSGCDLDLAPLADLVDLADVELFAAQPPPRRGRFTLLRPYLDAVDRLLARGADFDWLVYLSGQDYPVRPLAGYERLLAETEQDGFIAHWDIFSGEGPWGKSKRGVRRYFYQYREPPPWAHPWLRRFSWVNDVQTRVHFFFNYGTQVGVRSRSVPFRDGFRCWAGFQWHTLSRRCVEYLHGFTRANPGLVTYYERTICPDESYVQTVLLNSGRFRLSGDNHRYVDYTGSRDGHPRILTLADQEAIAGSGAWFARKFDPGVDARILDRLDELAARER
jgi:hypothetical protein